MEAMRAMEAPKQLRLVCANNHIFLPEPEIIVKLEEGSMAYEDLNCPVCAIQIRNVICKKCQHCVPPFSPCQCRKVNRYNCKCAADPLISNGIC